MLADVSMELPSEKGKQWGCYDYNDEKVFLQDIIAHFNNKGEAICHFQDPISSHIYFDGYTKYDDYWWEHTYGPSDLQPSKKKKSPAVDP